MMMILSSVIYKYLVPQEASGQNIRDVKRVLVLIGIGLTLIGFFIVPIILPLVFTEYTESIDAIRIMSLSFLPMTIARIYESKFLALEKSRFLLIGTLISISVLIPTMMLFGIWFEVLGIAISFVISTIIQVVYFLIVNRKWNFQQI
jgi:O-antigen/teichoic acid export membrane protein